MDDAQRAPGSADRSAVSNRIKQALAAGRISSADADIRLTNVGSAQSMAELGLIARDLDELQAAAVPAPEVSSGRTLSVLILALLVVLIAAGAAALIVIRTNGDDGQGSSGSVPSAQAPVASASDVTTSLPPVASQVAQAPGYSLSVAGIKGFLAAYRARFGSTRTLEMTFYPEYVITSVPQPKDRHSGWDYRDGGFTDFGGTTHNTSISKVFDSRPLNAAALVANLARAKRVLNVESGRLSHVIVSFVTAFDSQPTVRIYVSNQFNEGGYYTTTLGGKFLRKITY